MFSFVILVFRSIVHLHSLYRWFTSEMDGGSWSAAGQGDAGGDPPAGDWRTQLQPKARQRIVNKIMETLERHLPISSSERLNELKKIAVRFEEKFYTAATSETDYLRKISLKMLPLEAKTQNAASINEPSVNPAGGNQCNVDPEMDGGSWRTAGQGDTGGDLPAGDWRTQLQPEARQRIVNKITETLERHLLVASSEGLIELKKIAVRFEEKIYTAATSETDYLQKISLKMLPLESKTQNAASISPPSLNPAGGIRSKI